MLHGVSKYVCKILEKEGGVTWGSQSLWGSGYAQKAGCREHGNEPSGSIK